MPKRTNLGPRTIEPVAGSNTNVQSMYGDGNVVLAIGFGSLENAIEKLHVNAKTKVILVPTHSHLSAEMMNATDPYAVAVPLISMDADVIAVAEFLQGFKFQGSFCISTPDLPQPKLVMNEIKALCPDVHGIEFCSESKTCSCLVTTA